MPYADELRKHQQEFTQDIGHLINFAYANGFKLTFGRAYDLPEVQPILVEKGLSSTLTSQHPKRLAVDFNIFLAADDLRMLFPAGQSDEQYFADLKICEPLGSYWEDLNKLNKWGGRWAKPRDPYHFQRTF